MHDMIPEIKLTSKGAALLAKTPAGSAIPVTRWQIGTGSLPSGSSLDREALVMPLDDISIYDISESGNRATVLGQLLNQGRPEFVWEERGLWAQYPDEGVVLACYGNAFGAGEHIQAGTAQLREFIFGAVLIFDQAASVTAVIDTSLLFIPLREKAQPNGVATLDENGKVPRKQLPDFLLTAEPFQVYYNGGED